MAVGTNGGLLASPRAQSVLKHAILDNYVIRYLTMASTHLQPRRAVIVDGYAGRGRYDDGSMAGAERLMLAAHKAPSVSVDVFLVEKKRGHYADLERVADEWRARDVAVRTNHGRFEDLQDNAIEWATGSALFLFLDPCGALLPWASVTRALCVQRRSKWPATEALLNFNADLIRRVAGALHKGKFNGSDIVDRVCGGDWWRQVALDAYSQSGSDSWEPAASAVVHEYAARLAQCAGMEAIVTPIRSREGRQPKYYLIFLTRDRNGIWEYGDAVAKSRQIWLRFLDRQSEFTLFDIEQQIVDEQMESQARLRSNLLAIGRRVSSFRAIDHVRDVFGTDLGVCASATFTKALKDLERAGVVTVERGAKKPNSYLIRRV